MKNGTSVSSGTNGRPALSSNLKTKAMKRKHTAIHVYVGDRYVGNILYAHAVPTLSEEELEDLVLGTFPHVKGQKWRVVFA